jgi:putative ABC transport system ATP-binding protein
MSGGSGPSHPLLLLRDVSRDYRVGEGQVQALRGMSLEIAAGEDVAIVGPSGSGKSTLLNILGLLETASAGDYVFDGQPVAAWTAARRADVRCNSLGFVFQQFHLLPHLSAEANVELPLQYQQVTSQSRRHRVDECLQAVGMSHRRGHLPSQLSGGERQRVAIARALAPRPQVILADEPTGALDSTTGATVLDLMFSLARQSGATLLVITHDPAVAQRFSRRVSMRDGRLAGDTRQSSNEMALGVGK